MDVICRWCQQPFAVTAADLEFYQRISPVLNGIKFPLPAPTLCPADRKRRRLSFRNERTLYRRRCDFSGNEIISMYPQQAGCQVYEMEIWRSDRWDATDYGQEVDLTRPFFEQVAGLLRVVPLESLFNRANENSPFVNLSGSNKNCHLIFNSNFNESCLFCRGTAKSRDCLDIYFGINNELCYECINCHDCYAVAFSQNCSQCRDSRWLYNCSGCSDCFGCCNLIQKRFCLFNRQCSESEYRSFIGSRSGSAAEHLDDCRLYEQAKETALHRCVQNKMSEGCSGEYLSNSKNCRHCFEVHAGIDCAYADCTRFVQDAYDTFGFGTESELLLETVAIGLSNRVIFSCYGSNLQNVCYSHSCHNSSDLFGCVSMLRKSYCILNRQYSRDDYLALLPQIIEGMRARGEWGEFFSPQLSHFGYDESQAQEYFPLSREEAVEAGFNWSGAEIPPPAAAKIIDGAGLPQSLRSLNPGELQQLLSFAIRCDKSGRLFKLTKQELDFYLKMDLPLPRRHPEQRHMDRVGLRGPAQLSLRRCAKCGRPIETNLQPQRYPEVHCEECYRELVH